MVGAVGTGDRGLRLRGVCLACEHCSCGGSLGGGLGCRGGGGWAGLSKRRKQLAFLGALGSRLGSRPEGQ